MEEIKEIKLYSKGEFESWDSAKEEIVHGFELNEKENRELYEFVRRLLEKTYYENFVVSRIYKTIEHGYVIVLFRQTENEYGSYVGTISLYATLEDIIKNMKKKWVFTKDLNFFLMFVFAIC